MAELRRLQDERERFKRAELAQQRVKTPPKSNEFGFEFSTADIAAIREHLSGAKPSIYTAESRAATVTNEPARFSEAKTKTIEVGITE